MGTWRPATLDEVTRLVESQVARLSADAHKVWDSIRVDLRPARISRLGKHETVFVVGESEGLAVYWEDVEEGFNISPVDNVGNLLEGGGDQDDLSIALHKWVARQWPRFALTVLERDLLRLFHDLYGDQDFPDASELVVVARRNTGAGRFVDFQRLEERPKLENGYLDMGGKFITMEGVQDGLMAVVLITSHRVDYMEIVTYGNVSWDGVERPWIFE